MTRTLLTWIERALLLAGVLLAGWCAVVLVRAEYTRRMPIPPPTARAWRLPGDVGEPVAASSANGLVTATIPAGTWIARLEAPTAHLTATILEGSDDRTLARAAGHIEDTAFPGQGSNFAVAGHRDTIFRRVRNLHVGDPLVVTTADRVYRYRIAKTAIVNPTDVWVLDPTPHPTLTLVTCYPFEFLGHAPKRYIVTADLEQQEARVRRAGQP
jgi:sortase A